VAHGEKRLKPLRAQFKIKWYLFPFKTDPSVLDFKSAVEDIEGSVVVGDDDDAGVLFVGDLGEEFLPAQSD
jgi:hypothetical protein